MIKKKEYRNCKRLYSQRGKDNQVKPNPLGGRNDKKGGRDATPSTKTVCCAVDRRSVSGTAARRHAAVTSPARPSGRCCSIRSPDSCLNRPIRSEVIYYRYARVTDEAGVQGHRGDGSGGNMEEMQTCLHVGVCPEGFIRTTFDTLIPKILLTGTRVTLKTLEKQKEPQS